MAYGPTMQSQPHIGVGTGPITTAQITKLWATWTQRMTFWSKSQPAVLQVHHSPADMHQNHNLLFCKFTIRQLICIKITTCCSAGLPFASWYASKSQPAVLQVHHSRADMHQNHNLLFCRFTIRELICIRRWRFVRYVCRLHVGVFVHFASKLCVTDYVCTSHVLCMVQLLHQRRVLFS